MERADFAHFSEVLLKDRFPVAVLNDLVYFLFFLTYVSLLSLEAAISTANFSSQLSPEGVERMASRQLFQAAGHQNWIQNLSALAVVVLGGV